jgi:hypothetical protein
MWLLTSGIGLYGVNRHIQKNVPIWESHTMVS